MYFDRLKLYLVGLFASCGLETRKILEFRHTKSGSQRDWRESLLLWQNSFAMRFTIEMRTLGRILQATADVADFFDFFVATLIFMSLNLSKEQVAYLLLKVS